MASQQEQKIAEEIAKLAKAIQPKRKISNGVAITEYSNGQSVSLPMFGTNFQRSTTINQR